MIAKEISREEKELKLRLRLAQLERNEACQDNFLAFVKTVWPEFIAGRHHRIIAEKLERVARGELKRLIVNMPPRHTKSEFASYLFPAWMMGRDPRMKIIQATHTTELAVGFGRKTKNLLERDEYKEIFPDVKLASDSKASGRWDTSHGGMYYAVGVGSNLAGRGADLCLSPESLVMVKTSSGPRRVPIGGLEVGDLIATEHGFERVTRTARTVHSTAIRVNGVLCSLNHPFLTKRGWVQAGDLVEGDRVLTQSLWSKFLMRISPCIDRLKRLTRF